MDQRVLGVERDLDWLPRPNECRRVLSAVLPRRELITSAFALAFLGDRLLMTNLRDRGWDVPGGHVEPGEDPEAAMRREVYEETGARLGVARVLGYDHIRLLGPAPTGYRYPHPESYQVFFWARIAELSPFIPTDEAAERGLFGPEDAPRLAWVQRNSDLYRAALAVAAGQSGP